MALSLTAGRLETLAKAKDTQPMTDVMHALEKEFHRLNDFLNTDHELN